MNQEKQTELRTDFDNRVELSEQFALRLGEQIQELLHDKQITLAVPLEHRVKSWESLVKKVEINGLSPATVIDLPDFIGLRIILLFKRDVSRVCDILATSFDIINTEDTIHRLGVSQFGYQSIHMQIKLKESWLTVPTFSRFNGLSAEVQIRTAAQHIWAASSHILQYKLEQSVPPTVLRSINRVSALLETVDLEFERALNEREAYENVSYATIPSEQLNVDNFRIILNRELPNASRIADEDYAKVLIELNNIGITTVGHLLDFMKKFKQIAMDEDKRIVAILRKYGKDNHRQNTREADIDDIDGTITHYLADMGRVENGVFASHTGLIRFMIDIKTHRIKMPSHRS